ncbi:hypothetical protein HEQ52_18060 [Clostridium botulinum]|nr:hypothetical protein HEQ52_18060 [Clostridium botulinum]
MKAPYFYILRVIKSTIISIVAVMAAILILFLVPLSLPNNLLPQYPNIKAIIEYLAI